MATKRINPASKRVNPAVDSSVRQLRGRVRLREEPGEEFMYIAPRHWAALVIRSVIPFLVGLGALVGLVLRAMSREADFLGRQPSLFDALNIVLIVSVVLMAAAIAYIYFDWANDHLIISNQRIVHEDRTLWLAYNYEIIPMEQVQNVNKRVENVLQYVLNYGRIEIQSAGLTTPIVFKRAECPDEIQQRVLDEMQRLKRLQERERQQALIEQRVHGTNALPVPTPTLTQTATAAQPRQRQTQRSFWNTLFPLDMQVQNNVITWHRHWIVLLKLMLLPIAVLVVGLLLVWLFQAYTVFTTSTNTVLLAVLLVGDLLFVLWQYENWRNDIYILEPARIIDIQRLPLGLFEDRREATLGVIQNVLANSPNLIARMLGYGDVLVETAGAAGNFTFDHVPDPDEVQRLVFEYREAFKQRQREREWAATLDLFEMYDQARRNGPPQP